MSTTIVHIGAYSELRDLCYSLVCTNVCINRQLHAHCWTVVSVYKQSADVKMPTCDTELG